MRSITWILVGLQGVKVSKSTTGQFGAHSNVLSQMLADNGDNKSSRVATSYITRCSHCSFREKHLLSLLETKIDSLGATLPNLLSNRVIRDSAIIGTSFSRFFFLYLPGQIYPSRIN